MGRPRPLAPSTAQHRSGQTAAQASSCPAAWAVVGTRSWPSSLLLESSAAAVRERLWGSIPMVINGGLSSRRDGVRDGQPDFRLAHASVEPRHGGCRPRSGTLSASQPGGGKEPASQTAGTLDATGCRPARPSRDSTSQAPGLAAPSPCCPPSRQVRAIAVRSARKERSWKACQHPLSRSRSGRYPPGPARGRGHRPDRTAAGTQGFPASTRGDVALVTWAEGFGPVGAGRGRRDRHLRGRPDPVRARLWAGGG